MRLNPFKASLFLMEEMGTLRRLQIQIMALQAQISRPRAHVPQEPKSPLLTQFDGDHRKLCSFLNQCQLFFMLRLLSLLTDQTYVGLIISL